MRMQSEPRGAGGTGPWGALRRGRRDRPGIGQRVDPALLVGLLWALVVVSHLGLSHPPVRSALVKGLGNLGFLGAYSALSLALFLPMARVWWTSRGTGEWWWGLRSRAVTHAAELLGVVGWGFIVGGLLVQPPSAVLSQLHGDRPRVEGLALYTRHPLFVGLSTWAAGHLLVNGTAVDVAWWGGFVVLSVLGGLHQDWRKSRASPEYAAFVARTSFFPFVRQVTGRAGWNPGARAAAGFGAGALLAVGLRLLHPVLFMNGS